LVRRKVIEIVATRCQILRLICTKFDFGFAGGAYSAPPDPLPLKGHTSKGGKGSGGIVNYSIGVY